MKRFLVALAVLLGAMLVAMIGASSINRGSSSATATNASAAEPLLSYELDRLFRAARRRSSCASCFGAGWSWSAP